MNKLENKIKGALYAFAIGDAMGATTEFMDRDQIHETYGTVTDIIGAGWLNLPAGEVTDDTQMMICVYEGMKGQQLQQNAYGYMDTLDSICRQFRAWADTNPPDIGGACRRAIYGTGGCDAFEWMQANVQRQQAANYGDLGNGGLMRCLVPALMKNSDLAVDQALLTHTNVVTKECVRVYANTVKDALRYSFKPDRSCLHYIAPTGNVINTLYDAIYWFVQSYSVETAIASAVNDGGDADTIAALTGGLAGAYYGYSNIPKRWVQQLNPAIREKLDEITQYILEQYANE